MTIEIKYGILGLIALFMICVTIVNTTHAANKCIVDGHYSVVLSPNN